MTTIFGQIDTGELAARLGSINTFDRRGHTVWMDDFENGVNKWTTEASGDDASVEQNITRFRSGGSSCKLTAGSTGNPFARIYTLLSFSVTGTFGYEFSFAIDSNTSTLDLHTLYYDGADLHVAGIRYDHANTDLYYESANGVWTIFDSSFSLVALAELFHTLKLVPDYANGLYSRLLIDAEVIDVSAYAIHSSALVVAPFLQVEIRNTGRLLNNDVVYVDDVIITQNEP